jgi:hypothetical protein
MKNSTYQLDYDLWQLFLNLYGNELAERDLRFKEIVRADDPFITIEFEDALGVQFVEAFVAQEQAKTNNKIVKLEVVKNDLTEKTDWLKEQSLSTLVGILGDLKAKKTAIAKEEKQVNAEINTLEAHILPLLKKQELTKATVTTSSGNFTISCSEQIHPQPDPEKWEEVFKWIIENERTELLMKRINSAPYRESLDEKLETPPGVQSYTKTSLNLRKI